MPTALDQPLVGGQCPACDAPASGQPGPCPSCGFHLETARTRFGVVPRYSIYVTDSTEAILSPSEFRSIEARLMRFGNQFPQSRFSVFFTALLPGLSVKEYAFWLFNCCNFTPFDSKLSNNFALLLVVDMQSRSACLMAGYGLEPYLSTEDLNALAAKIVPGFRRRRYAEGVRSCVDATARLLQERLETGGQLPATVALAALPSSAATP